MTVLSATFVNIPTDQVDSRIEKALGQIVDFLGVDRSSLGEFSEDKKQLHVTHSYVKPAFPPLPLVVLDEVFPWYTEQLRQGNVLKYSRLPDDLPPEAESERAYCLQSGFKAHLAIPLCVGGLPIGVLGFGSFRVYREWPDRLVHRLRLLGEIFGNALSRKRSVEKAHYLSEQLARVSRAMTVGELAVTIAHEINQPLCAIVNNAHTGEHILARDSPVLDELREVLRAIVSDSNRATEFVKRIRCLVQKESIERVPFDLNQAIRDVVQLLSLEMSRAEIELSLNLAADLPRVLGDQ